MSNRTVPADAEGMPETDVEATAEWLAQQEFEPWRRDPGEPPLLPSNAEWTDDGIRKLALLRLAHVVMFKSKAELMELVKADPDGFIASVESFNGDRAWFDGMAHILSGASARLMIAAAAVGYGDGHPTGPVAPAEPVSRPEGRSIKMPPASTYGSVLAWAVIGLSFLTLAGLSLDRADQHYERAAIVDQERTVNGYRGL